MQMSGKIMPLCAALLCALLALTACGGNHVAGTGNDSGQDSATSLPKPEAAGGSVTGMPDKPGPGQVGPPALGPDTSVASDGEFVAPPVDDGMLPGDVEPPSPGNTDGVPDDLPLPPGEPTAQDAVTVLRDYYAAIDTHDYAHAYALWSDGGRSSGKAPQQFADGFADTTNVSVQMGAPSRLDAAAGSRYVEVPVTISATRRDGSVRRYTGSYTLRRAVVDGATAEQRAWRIASADVRDLD